MILPSKPCDSELRERGWPTDVRVPTKPIAALGWAAVIIGCRAVPAPVSHVSERPPRAHPPSVVLDPVFSAPSVRDQAAASAQVFTLRAPVSNRAMHQTIEAFFLAVVKEDAEALVHCVTTDAVMLSRARGVAGLIDQWRSRLRSLNYEALKGQRLYRPSDIETYEYDDLEGMPSGRLPPRPAEMSPGDRLVRVPLAIVRVAGDRVFGDEMMFLLRPVERAYRIRAIMEDFQPP